MKKFLILLAIVGFSCTQEKPTYKNWVLEKEIQLDNVNPIGITVYENQLWISDSDHNRVVQISDDGKITKTIDSLERPMHIASDESEIFIPQYGNDQISMFKNDEISTLSLTDSLDAPAGISVYQNERAIADFYNHRILYSDGKNWISFGKEGKSEGEFYYPTDVQITADKIFVADAYNNRIQVFDKQGKFLQKIGEAQKMNAATGIFVTEKEIYITDFENDRIFIFDMNGNVMQELSETIEKPTDMLIYKDKLYVLNYRKGTINVYQNQ